MKKLLIVLFVFSLLSCDFINDLTNKEDTTVTTVTSDIDTPIIVDKPEENKYDTALIGTWRYDEYDFGYYGIAYITYTEIFTFNKDGTGEYKHALYDIDFTSYDMIYDVWKRDSYTHGIVSTAIYLTGLHPSSGGYVGGLPRVFDIQDDILYFISDNGDVQEFKRIE